MESRRLKFARIEFVIFLTHVFVMYDPQYVIQYFMHWLNQKQISNHDFAK